MTGSKLQVLRNRLGEIADLRSALAVLHWDQETYMPSGAAEGRGRQIATLSALHHRLFTESAMGELLDELNGSVHAADGDTAKLLAETQYDYNRAKCLPESFVHEFALEQSQAYVAWVEARRKSCFKTFQPHLEKVVELLRQKADLLGFEGSPYNALLEDYERGMTAEQLRGIFGELGVHQSALVQRITASVRPEPEWLNQEWNEQAQWGFSLHVLKAMGYDFEAGRQDKSVHPFTTSFGLRDVRITTRMDSRNPFSGLFGSIHEGGHALYEQGFEEKDGRTPLADAPSLGIHESQSRMWENLIGRSLPFWKHFLPHFQKHHTGKLDEVRPEEVFRAVNRVAPSLIRVEADECTYNLHIILRFEIEVDLIEARIQVEDIPEIWNSKVKQYLGLEVPNDTLGCLQDIHWSHGSMGYFPTYALGNLYSAQLFVKIQEDIPDLWEQVEAGVFSALLGWLRKHVHSVGRRKTAAEIVQDASGEPPGAEAFLKYLESKYGGLYGL